jgi:hypothetical protein
VCEADTAAGGARQADELRGARHRKEGESCLCVGHMCSKSVNQCLKLCATTSSQLECGTKKCTSVPYLPTGWGVCT